jgi:hypothetical protein
MTHILQYVAVLETDEKSAIQAAQSYLDEVSYNRWFDWCDAEGGRWADTDKPISHKAQPKEFVEKVAELINGREEEVDDIYRKARATGYEFDDLARMYGAITPLTRDESLALYGYNNIMDLIYERWTWNSRFYDIVNDTPSFFELHEAVNECVEADDDDDDEPSLWLVPVDFHF